MPSLSPPRFWMLRLTPPALVSLLAGCAGLTHGERGALVGTAVGALGGAVIGHQTGNPGLGTVLGAGTGMIAGTLIGDAEDARQERDAAVAYARAAELRAAQPPLTNADLIYMAQNGLGDEVILNAVRSRGGRFQLDPAALVELKRHGVSDAVLAQIQQMGGSVVAVPGGGAGRCAGAAAGGRSGAGLRPPSPSGGLSLLVQFGGEASSAPLGAPSLRPAVVTKSARSLRRRRSHAPRIRLRSSSM